MSRKSFCRTIIHRRVGNAVCMRLSEQLNDLDRKVLGAAPVDRARSAAPYDDAVGELAPLARTLGSRAGLYALGAVAIGVHLALAGSWTTLLDVLVLALVPALLVAKLSTNAFPARFPEAPPGVLAPAKVGGGGRLVLAVTVAVLCLADLLLLHGEGEQALFVLAGLPAVVLWCIHAEVTSREEAGFVLASRVRQRGRVGRGIYRVTTG
jgi:hypothetical protein